MRRSTWLAVAASSLGLAACPDLGDEPMDWSAFDPPVSEAPADAAPEPDAGWPDGGQPQQDAGVIEPVHDAQVRLQYLAIVPAYVLLEVGGTVTWTNLDSVPHDIRSGSPSQPTPIITSALLDRSESFRFTFTEPGVVLYYCSTHSNNMINAVIEVVEVP
jgi:plastocyanin